MTGADAKYASQVIWIENNIRFFADLESTMSAFCSIGFSWFSETVFVWRQVILRIPDTVFDSSNFIERQLSKHGGHKTKLVSLRNAMQLVMVLPGKMAKETRAQFAGVIERYIAGDMSLLVEIEANASSTSPIAQMARRSLDCEDEDPLMVGFKRKREQLELLKMEQEIKTAIVNDRAKDADTRAKDADTRAKDQTRVLDAIAEIERLRDPGRCNLDERTRLMLQDSFQNSILTGNIALISDSTNVKKSDPSPNTPISIASVAKELGYKPTTTDAKRIGLDLRKRYIEKHGSPPTKHDQLCDGRVTQVNSYTEQDRSLMEEALHAYFKPDEQEDGEGGD
jgi:hypothetical protein